MGPLALFETPTGRDGGSMQDHRRARHRVTAYHYTVPVAVRVCETRAEAESEARRFGLVPGTHAEIEVALDGSATGLQAFARQPLGATR